jgi:hypothetical protein
VGRVHKAFTRERNTYKIICSILPCMKIRGHANQEALPRSRVTHFVRAPGLVTVGLTDTPPSLLGHYLR